LFQFFVHFVFTKQLKIAATTAIQLQTLIGEESFLRGDFYF